jgi:toxin ParE1/3/4
VARRVTFRPEAEADLDAIYDHIARDSVANAVGFTERIRAFCEAFSEFSERGTLRPNLGADLRVIGFERRVAIVFRVLADRVQIVRVFYGGRDIERLLREG